LGNTNLRGYLNNWNHRRKFGFKITDAIEKIQKLMILNGGKEKFTINSKDLGVARDYKIDFEGISHLKNQF
jgi:excinuclease ABC subunit A